jgi:hypothetical protein
MICSKHTNTAPRKRQIVPLPQKPILAGTKATAHAKTSKSSKMVHFSETSEGVVLHPKTFLDRKLSWYTKKEIKYFRQNMPEYAKLFMDTNSSSAHAYVKQTLVNPEELDAQRFNAVEYVTGIEHILDPRVYKALCVAAARARRDVIEEQRRQKSLGINDVDMIAAASTKSSKFPKMWRERIALINWLEADRN